MTRVRTWTESINQIEKEELTIMIYRRIKDIFVRELLPQNAWLTAKTEALGFMSSQAVAQPKRNVIPNRTARTNYRSAG